RGHKFSLSCKDITFEVGNFEPLFFHVALYNVKTKQKLSENYYFHFNSQTLISQMTMEAQKLVEQPTSCQDTIIVSKECSDDVYLVFWVERILYESVDNANKPYENPRKYSDERAKRIKTISNSYLALHRQRCMFGYI